MSKIYRVAADSKEQLDKILRESIQTSEQKKPSYQTKDYQVGFVYTDNDDYRQKIHLSLETKHNKQESTSQHDTCFLYTGQGCQFPGMAKELYDTNLNIRDSLEYYAKVLDPNNQLKYLSCLIENIDDIHQTKYTQPSIVMLQLALNKFWQAVGINPDFLIGHSVGEFSASVAHGYYTEETILKLIAKRADLMQNVKVSGSMIAIKSGHDAIKSILDKEMILLDFAAFNAPDQTVLSGCNQQIKKMKEQCRIRNIKARILTVSHPFHSKLMQPVIEQFSSYCQGIQAKQHSKSSTLFSNLDGKALKHSQDAQYWCDHILKPVMFMQSVESAWNQGARTFIEIGPDSVLSRLAKKILSNKEETCVIHTMKKGKATRDTTIEAALKLEQLGHNINWELLSTTFALSDT